MAKIEETYLLDLMPGTIPQSIHLSQNDAGWRELKFSLHDRGKPFTVPSGTVAFFNGKKSDGKGFSYKMKVADSTVSITVQPQMTTAAGPVICEVSLQSGSEVIGSANLLLVVERCPLDGAQMSDSDMSAVNEAAARIGEAIAAAQTAIAKASEANTSAGRAASSANAASTSESQAAASAKAAADSAAAAKQSETNAGNYATATREAKEEAVKAIDDETTAQKAVITSHANSAATTAGNTAVKAVTDQQEKSVQAVKDQQTASVKAVEAAINTQVSDINAAITAEVQRATDAEAAINTQVSDNSAAITSEVTRAKGAESDITTQINNLLQFIGTEIIGAKIIDTIYPVGSIMITVSSTNPGSLPGYAGTTWEEIKGRFLLAHDSSHPAASTGGEYQHKLTESEMPSHHHELIKGDPDDNPTGGKTQAKSNLYYAWADPKLDNKYYWQSYTGFVGGSSPHNITPPYLSVYMWKRTG